MRASIIVPVHNAGRFLDRTLSSWLEQSGIDTYEVVLVDNNSTDAALARLPRNPRLRITREPAQGAYRARNRGVEAASGEVLVFTDPDCRAEPTWLAQLLSRMDEPGVELVMGRVRHAGTGRLIRLLSAYDHTKEMWTLSQSDPALYYGHTNNMAVSRTAWEAAGPFAFLPRGADTILVQKILERFGTRAVVYHPDALVHHLEVESARMYFGKCRLYGKSYRQYRRVVNARGMSWLDHWRVSRQTVHRERLAAMDALALLALVGLGMACYGWGLYLETPRAGAGPVGSRG